MKLKLFTIYDKKTKVHTPPIHGHNRGQIYRQLEMDLKKGSSTIVHYPDDYQLYEVGVFDDQSGLVEGHSLDFVCEMSDIITQSE